MRGFGNHLFVGVDVQYGSALALAYARSTWEGNP